MSDRKKISIDRFDQNCGRALRYVKKSETSLIVYDTAGPIATITPYRREDVREQDPSVNEMSFGAGESGDVPAPFRFLERQRPLFAKDLDDTPEVGSGNGGWSIFSWPVTLARLGAIFPNYSRTE